MRSAHFDIQLQQPAIFTLQSGSAGTPRGLDFIPGATLLGHVAARLYARLGANDAWMVFHSGKVRFGDALPVVAGEPGHPMPLSWHADKGARIRRDGCLVPEMVYDAAFADRTDRQPVQLRSGYVSRGGRVIDPARVQTLKTAIDAETGQAAESQLFGYEALDAGQSFRGAVSADDDVPDALWRQVQAAVQGSAWLGRSRSAQFGEALISPVPLPDDPPPANAGTSLTLWLQSDLALEQDGQPCLQPHPALLGLPPRTEWLVAKSFLRSRSYSPYNAYRRHYDRQRQVITRGSVLRYELSDALPADALVQLQRGLGLHVEAGLGSAWVNPPLLVDAHPVFTAAPAETVAPANPGAAPEAASPFIHALRGRRARLSGQSTEDAARALLARFVERLRAAMRYNSLVEPPGRSQWGRLKQVASDLRHDRAKLAAALGDEKKGILRARSGWDLRFGTAPDDVLGKWLWTELDRTGGNLAEVLGQLATTALHGDPVATASKGEEQPA